MESFDKATAKYIGRLANQLRRRIDRLSLTEHFSGTQGKVLHFILAQTGDVFQKDVEEEFGMRSSSATELLKLMEKNGIIIRESADYDNRLKKIVATPKALQYKKQVIEDITGLEAQLHKDIPKEKMDIFYEVLEQMMKNLAE